MLALLAKDRRENEQVSRCSRIGTDTAAADDGAGGAEWPGLRGRAGLRGRTGLRGRAGLPTPDAAVAADDELADE